MKDLTRILGALQLAMIVAGISYTVPDEKDYEVKTNDGKYTNEK